MHIDSFTNINVPMKKTPAVRSNYEKNEREFLTSISQRDRFSWFLTFASLLPSLSKPGGLKAEPMSTIKAVANTVNIICITASSQRG